MKIIKQITLAIITIVIPMANADTIDISVPKDISACPSYFDIEMRKLHSSKTINLCSYYKAGKPILIVNTASHCGFTPQLSGLQNLYDSYKEQGFVILGFPSNSFNQEEKTEAGTANVCYKNHGVTFPMFSHIDVKGEKTHPLFKYLAKKSQTPTWNFNKYLLVDGEIQYFGSKIKPQNSPLEESIKLSF